MTNMGAQYRQTNLKIAIFHEQPITKQTKLELAILHEKIILTSRKGAFIARPAHVNQIW